MCEGYLVYRDDLLEAGAVIALLLPATILCGSCGNRLLVHKIAKTTGVAQVICVHRECAEYDLPMEFELPVAHLRPTTDPATLAEVEPPRIAILN